MGIAVTPQGNFPALDLLDTNVGWGTKLTVQVVQFHNDGWQIRVLKENLFDRILNFFRGNHYRSKEIAVRVVSGSYTLADHESKNYLRRFIEFKKDLKYTDYHTIVAFLKQGYTNPTGKAEDRENSFNTAFSTLVNLISRVDLAAKNTLQNSPSQETKVSTLVNEGVVRQESEILPLERQKMSSSEKLESAIKAFTKCKKECEKHRDNLLKRTPPQVLNAGSLGLALKQASKTVNNFKKPDSEEKISEQTEIVVLQTEYLKDSLERSQKQSDIPAAQQLLFINKNRSQYDEVILVTWLPKLMEIANSKSSR